MRPSDRPVPLLLFSSPLPCVSLPQSPRYSCFFLTTSLNPPRLANIVSANVFGKDRGCLWDGWEGRGGEREWGGGGGKEGFGEGGEMKKDGIRR